MSAVISSQGSFEIRILSHGSSPCSCFLPDQSSEHRQFAADFIAGGITGVVKRYALIGCTTCEKDLEAILYDLLSGSAFQ